MSNMGTSFLSIFLSVTFWCFVSEQPVEKITSWDFFSSGVRFLGFCRNVEVLPRDFPRLFSVGFRILISRVLSYVIDSEAQAARFFSTKIRTHLSGLPDGIISDQKFQLG
jgi:hypothetical protein